MPDHEIKNQKSKFKHGVALVFLATCAALAGCDKPGAPVGTGPMPSERIISGPGMVRGVVQFDGTPPEMKVIANDHCVQGVSKPLKEETVVVGPDGGLANVFVWIDGLGPAAPRGESPVLDQINCQYVPHALGVTIGQPLKVRSSDPTIHNVNFKGARNPEINFGMTDANQEKTVKFGAAEFLKTRCDVHPWMLAHVGVFENSYFAVTPASGAFEISNLPVGSYTLRAWHERYGMRDMPVQITDKPLEGLSIVYSQ